MFGFFNPQSKTQVAFQLLNAAAFVTTIAKMAMEPQQSYRFGLDLAVHGLTCIALQYNDNTLGRLAAAGVNFARLGAIYADATGQDIFGCGEVADTVLHSANIFATTLGG